MEKKRKRGRPPKPVSALRRNNVTIRFRDQTKQMLQESAAKNGRSLSEEIEARIERSSADDDYFRRMREELGGAEAYALLMIIGRVMHRVGPTAAMMDKKDPRTWSSNPFAYDQVVKGVMTVLDAMRPPGEVKTPPTFTTKTFAEFANPGTSLATSDLIAITNPDGALTEELRQWGLKIQSLIAEREEDR